MTLGTDLDFRYCFINMAPHHQCGFDTPPMVVNMLALDGLTTDEGLGGSRRLSLMTRLDDRLLPRQSSHAYIV
jgi:hypothetical protein